LESGTINTNGQELYYEVHGDGPPLVLIMGIGLDSTLWGLRQLPAFSKAFQVIAFDNRDAGRSSQASAPYTIADMAEDTAGLLGGLGIDRTHMLGHSMGGMIAMEFALSHPERLDKLVLSGTTAGSGRAKFDPVSIMSFVAQHDSEGLTTAAQQLIWYFSTDFLRNHQAVEETLALFGSNPNPMTADGFERQAQAYASHDALDRIGEIGVPTLVLTGEQDRLVPPWLGREIADAIPGAEFHLVEGSGSSHAALLERPDDYNKVVVSFLSE